MQGQFTYEPNQRLAKHLNHRLMDWFWFLIDPEIDATNYRAEEAVRPAVVNRNTVTNASISPSRPRRGIAQR